MKLSYYLAIRNWAQLKIIKYWEDDLRYHQHMFKGDCFECRHERFCPKGKWLNDQIINARMGI